MNWVHPPAVLRPISREVQIEARVDHVWLLVTDPQHLVQWFSDDVEMDRRVGGSLKFTWDGHGSFPGRIERLDAPHVFAFSWLRVDEASLVETSTLVEISLEARGTGTLVRVVESGFSRLPWSDERRLDYRRENDRGWARELAELASYASRTGRAATTTVLE
jgi:uncharacterized protein YndB with AHSA1/START domain